MARTTRLLLHGSPAIHRALSHFLQHLLRWHGASGCMALFITLHRRIFLYCEILISNYEKIPDFCTFTGQKTVLHYEKLT
ncbi:hypothetical protein [Comamonas terrigena]|uniref:hypothetical protein n=1 Tax=Comamonas terrigena TaxID=32013 RepID=UPI0028A11506|nr:hypothetical protein [Comamonas terrigena]